MRIHRPALAVCPRADCAASLPGAHEAHRRVVRGLLGRLASAVLPAFRPPTRVNGHPGYPLGPTRTPKLPRLSEPPSAPAAPQAGPDPAMQAIDALFPDADLSPSRSRSASPGRLSPARLTDDDALLDANWPSPASSERSTDSPSLAVPLSPMPDPAAPPADAAPARAASPPVVRLRVVTAADVLHWQGLPQRARDEIGFKAYARRHGLDPYGWQRTVRHDGRPHAPGQRLLDAAAGTTYRAITVDHVRDWQGMSTSQRRAIGVVGYAHAHALDPLAWRRTVRLDGIPLAKGKLLLDKADGKSHRPITWAHVAAWQHLPQAERNRLGFDGYAQSNGLNPGAWRKYVHKDGTPSLKAQRLRDAGAATAPRRITDLHLLRWRNMTQAERDAIGIDRYAMDHHLPINSWRSQVNPDGTLTPAGEALLHRPGPSRRP